jgi:hypothetical protein
VGIGGLFLGDAGSIHNGVTGGNFGGLTLQLSWWRDLIDIALLAGFVYVGFVADRRAGRLLMFGIAGVLLLLTVVGFLKQGSGIGPLHFPIAINVFDLITGVLALLTALGTIEDDPAPAG